MTKRPAFQWYPGDAQRDTALRACCLEARGLWREMLDIMHDVEPYGYLTAGGVPIDAAALARMVGITLKRCTVLVKELEDRGVFSRTEEGVIYSRRMVRDGKTYKEWCEKSAKGGQASATKRATKAQPPPQPNPQPEANTAVGSLQSASARKGNGAPDVLEAGELVQRIRSLAQQDPSSGNAFLHPHRVEELGADVFRAFKAVGGPSRFLTGDAKETSILISQFGKALYSARHQ